MTSRKQLIQNAINEIERIVKELPDDISDDEKYKIFAKLQVSPTYLIFQTYYTEPLLEDEKAMNRLKEHKVAVVHDEVIDMSEEDMPFFKGKTFGSVVFHAAEHNKKTLENLLEDLDYCSGIHDSCDESESFINGKLVKYYVYDCESG